MILQLEARLTAGDHDCWEKPGFIVVWAQWANVDGQPPEKQAVPPGPWFDAIKAAADDSHVKLVNDWKGGPADGKGLSFLTGKWTWPIKREFIWPYNKRTWVTNSTTLNTSGWCVRHEHSASHLVTSCTVLCSLLQICCCCGCIVHGCMVFP